MVHYFKSDKPELTLQIGKKEMIQFLNHQYIATDDDAEGKKVIKAIKGTNFFKMGRIQEVPGPVVVDKHRNVVASGSRGTDNNDEVARLRRELADAQAKIRDLESAEVPA